MTSKKLNMIETVQVADKLRAVCHADGDGYAVYEEDWDDERVAKSFEFEVTDKNVSSIRLQLIGKLRPKSGGVEAVTKDDLKRMASKINDLDYFMRAMAHVIGISPVEMMTRYEYHLQQEREFKEAA